MAGIKPLTQELTTAPETHEAAPSVTIWRNGKMIQREKPAEWRFFTSNLADPKNTSWTFEPSEMAI